MEQDPIQSRIEQAFWGRFRVLVAFATALTVQLGLLGASPTWAQEQDGYTPIEEILDGFSTAEQIYRTADEPSKSAESGARPATLNSPLASLAPPESTIASDKAAPSKIASVPTPKLIVKVSPDAENKPLTPHPTAPAEAQIGQRGSVLKTTPVAKRPKPAAPAVVSLTAGSVPNVPLPVSHGPFGGHLDGYRVRAEELKDPSLIGSSTSTVDLPMSMWWEKQMGVSVGLSPRAIPVDVGKLTETALSCSPLVRSILTEPNIRSRDIVIADAEFDPTVFLEGKFTDTNEPVGSALTTGDDSDRFRDETFTAIGGIRKKARGGAAVELSQRSGFQENNSQFLDPNPQGTTRLEFNFTQPLMRDRGHAVNNVRILLAQLDYQVANAAVRSDLEDHLVKVAQAYWDLYLARADWLQRKKLLEGAERLHRIIQARTEVDSQRRQFLRAQAALASRKSALIRATTRIRDVQAQLRLLTGSRQLIQAQQWELVPKDSPLTQPVDVSSRQSVITALDNRSDIAQAIRNVQAVSARVGAAKNQVLPKLDLILGAYTAGLDDKRNVFGAWSNQFNDGRPTYWAGLVYEIPIRNRANQARLTRNRWELTRAIFDFQQTTEVAFTEVEVAVRETRTSYNEMMAKRQAIAAANNEVDYLRQRWELLPDPNESAVLLIEDLLDAQDRLANEERSFVVSQVAYALSWIQLRKVMGTLLRFDSTDQRPIIKPPKTGPIDRPAVDKDAASARLVSPQTPRTVLGSREGMYR